MARQIRKFDFLQSKKINVLFLVFTVFITSFFVSCNESQKPPVESQKKFAVLRYDINIIKKWLDTTTNKAFIFQFYTNKYDQSDSVWQALSYIVDSAGYYRNGTNPDTLRLDTEYSNDTAQFTGKIVLGNNAISAKRMRELILKTDGTPKGQFVIFFPRINSQHRHVYYRIVVELDKKLTGDEDDTDPCPPRICWEDN